MQIKRTALALLLLLAAVTTAASQCTHRADTLGVSSPETGSQWTHRTDVPGIISPETGRAPEAWMWIPPQTDSVRAVMFAMQNMAEETLFHMPEFRDSLAAMDIALLWFTPGFAQEGDDDSKIMQMLDSTLHSLIQLSDNQELLSAHLIPFGHSAQATMPWNFGAWNPKRTLCIISYHGDAPRTPLPGYARANVEWGRTRNIDGIPGLMIMGEYEWWDARVLPALAFRMMYPKSCISFLCDAGRGHFDVSPRTARYIARFISKALQARGESLTPVDPDEGWLAEWWQPSQASRAQAAPAKEYQGNPDRAFWYFDREMAMMTEQRYAETSGKKAAYVSVTLPDGSLAPYRPDRHVKISIPLQSLTDSGEFTLKGVMTDSLRSMVLPDRPGIEPKVSAVCGPVRPTGPNRFAIDINRAGIHDSRRCRSITMLVEAPGDSLYKETVQEFEITIPDSLFSRLYDSRHGPK